MGLYSRATGRVIPTAVLDQQEALCVSGDFGNPDTEMGFQNERVIAHGKSKRKIPVVNTKLIPQGQSSAGSSELQK